MMACSFLLRCAMLSPLCETSRANHHKVFPAAGLAVKPYRYYLPSTFGLDLPVSAPAACIIKPLCTCDGGRISSVDSQSIALATAAQRRRRVCWRIWMRQCQGQSCCCTRAHTTRPA